MKRQKRCDCCRRCFTPYPRAWKTQTVCRRQRCRRWRAERARDRYREAHPDCFKERYPKTKLWLAEHPGYLRDYRVKHPEYVTKDNRQHRERRLRAKRLRADMQDGLRRREITRIRCLRGADIQDTLRLRLDGVLDLLAGPPGADIQDAMARPAGAPLPCGP